MNVHYILLKSGDPLPDIRELSPFKAIIVIEDIVDTQWQATTSRWLADSGCRYMLAWGKGCSSWDDSVDWANLEQFDYGEIPDDDFILTSWHEDDPLEEVIWFAKCAAWHSTVTMHHFVFVHISSINRHEEFEAMYKTA